MEKEFKKLIKILLKKEFTQHKLKVLKSIKNMNLTVSTISKDLNQSQPLIHYHLYKFIDYGVVVKKYENKKQTKPYFVLSQLGSMVLEVTT